MHPDQKTPETHRYRAADSNPEKALGDRQPEQDLHSDAIENEMDTASDEPGSAPEMDGERVAEAGNAYVGRTMDDSLKSSPRVETPGAGTDDG